MKKEVRIIENCPRKGNARTAAAVDIPRFILVAPSMRGERPERTRMYTRQSTPFSKPRFVVYAASGVPVATICPSAPPLTHRLSYRLRLALMRSVGFRRLLLQGFFPSPSPPSSSHSLFCTKGLLVSCAGVLFTIKITRRRRPRLCFFRSYHRAPPQPAPLSPNTHAHNLSGARF